MAESPVPIRGTDAVVQDHSRQYAGFTFVYPVISRRSRGLSLGVNLNPDKVCNFDCIYCEVDRRTPGRAPRVDLPQLRRELTALIRFVQDGGLGREPRFAGLPAGVTREIRDIAFSGDGEPTMVANFAECAEAVAAIRHEEGLQQTRLVLITNAAGLDKADVRRGLEILDAHQGEIWGKLDAGTEAYYRRVNRTTIRFDRILRNLLETARVRPIVIQSLFLQVHGQPPPAEELHAYCDRLAEILRGGGRIREVHAYTVARPTPEAYATRLASPQLDSIARVIRERTGLPVMTFE
jgi:wyosine [tRNA(Phe)-imidazoG37] synthetase (radical SAM superfamily)